MTGWPESYDELAVFEWFDQALRDHGYYDEQDEGDREDTLGEMWVAHSDSSIPSRTTGVGEPVRAIDWHRDQGETVGEYLAYLNRQCLRTIRRKMLRVNPSNLGEQEREKLYDALAASETVTTFVNLDHAKEIEAIPSHDPSRSHPSAN